MTDPSRYLEEELHEGEGCLLCCAAGYGRSSGKVKDLLQNDSGGMKKMCGAAERLWSRSIPGQNARRHLAEWIRRMPRSRQRTRNRKKTVICCGLGADRAICILTLHFADNHYIIAENWR